MAVDVGELLVSIAFDTIDMKKGIDQANSYLSSFSGKLTAVTNAVEAQTSIMSVAMDALGNNFQQATKSMIESNKNASDSVAKMGDSIRELGKSIETSATRNKEAMQKQTNIIKTEAKNSVDNIKEMAKKSVAEIKEMNKHMHDSTVDAVNKMKTAMDKMATARETMAGKMESGMKAVANSGEMMAKSMGTSSEKVSNAISGMRGSVTLSLDGVKKAVQSFASANAISMTNFSNKVQEAQAATIGALREIDWAFQHLATANTRAAEVLERSSASMIGALRSLKNFASATLRQLTSSFREFESSITKISGGSSLLDIVNELRKVQQEIMKTNDLLKNSAINVRNVGSAGAEATGALSKGFDHASYFTEGFMGKIRMVVMDLFFLQMAAQQAFGILNAIFGQGIKFAAEMETSIIGMAAVMSSTMTLNDADIPFIKAMEISKLVIEDLKVEALRTTATLEELMTVFQAILGPATQMGMSLTQIKDFTVFGANAVKSLGLNHQQLVQELRSIVTDNITTRGSTLATALGITGTDIENAKNSAEGVFGFLEKRMKGFQMAINETAGTFSAMLSNIQDGLQQTQEQGFGRLFKYIKSEMGLIQNIFFQFERHTADVFDDAGKKIFSKGDMKVETVQLNQNTVAAFATLSKITSDIYFDIKNFVTELFNSENTAKNLHNVFYSLVGVVRAIYQNIYQIATLFATWTIVSGNLATKFFALVVATGNLERLLLFVQNHIVGVVAAMITWQTMARVVGFAFTFVTAQAQFLKVQVDATSTSMQILAARAAMLRSVMTAFAPIMSSIIMLAVMMYTAFNGVDATLAFIKEHIVSIGIAFAGWNIAMLIAPFSAIGAAVVTVISVVAILLDSFGVLGNVVSVLGSVFEFLSQVIITAGLVLLKISPLIAAYYIATNIAAISTAIFTAATAVMNTVMALFTPIMMAASAAMTWFSAASSPITAIILAIIAAIIVLAGLLALATDKWYIAGAAIDWIKDKWNSLTGGIWANNSALEDNIRLQQEAAQIKGSIAYLESMGMDEKDIQKIIDEGDINEVADRRKKKQREDTKKLLAELGKTGAKYADLGDGGGKGGGKEVKKEERMQEALGKFDKAVIDGERKVAVEGYKNALKDLEEQYKANTIGISQYYEKQLEFNIKIKEAEKDALEKQKAEEEELAATVKGLGDEAKAIDHLTNVKKIEYDIDLKDTEIKRLKTQNTIDQTEAYKKLDKELTKINFEFAKSHGGLTDEQMRIEVADKYADQINHITANLAELEGLKKKDIALTAEQIARYNELTLALKNLGITQVEAFARMKVDEIKRNVSLIESNAGIKKSDVNDQLRSGQISDWEARQRIYDIENAEAKELEVRLRELIATQNDLKNSTTASSDEIARNAKEISDLKSKIISLKHPMSVIAETMRNQLINSMEDGFASIIDGTKSASEAFREMGRQIIATAAKILSNMFVQKLFSGIFGGLFGGGMNVTSSVTAGGAGTSLIPAPGKAPGKATGGYISGPGTETSDSIPAMLSNGEFVIRAAAVKAIGVETLNRINSFGGGRLPQLQFAGGGYVGKSGGANTSSNLNQQAPIIKIEVHNETGTQANAEVTDMKFDGEQWVMSLWLRGLSKNTLGARDLMKGMK